MRELSGLDLLDPKPAAWGTLPPRVAPNALHDAIHADPHLVAGMIPGERAELLDAMPGLRHAVWLSYRESTTWTVVGATRQRLPVIQPGQSAHLAFQAPLDRPHAVVSVHVTQDRSMHPDGYDSALRIAGWRARHSAKAGAAWWKRKTGGRADRAAFAASKLTEPRDVYRRGVWAPLAAREALVVELQASSWFSQPVHVTDIAVLVLFQLR